MKATLALLVASTALTTAIGLPVWAATHGLPDTDDAIAAVFEAGGEALPLLLASDDDDDDRRDRRSSRRDDDDDDDDDDGGDCDDDDDDDCRGAASPAPAGTVAPPQNGLFGSGALPQVRVN